MQKFLGDIEMEEIGEKPRKKRHVSGEWRKKIIAQLKITADARKVAAELGCLIIFVEQVKASLSPLDFLSDKDKEILVELRNGSSALKLSRRTGQSYHNITKVARLAGIELGKKRIDKKKKQKILKLLEGANYNLSETMRQLKDNGIKGIRYVDLQSICIEAGQKPSGRQNRKSISKTNLEP